LVFITKIHYSFIRSTLPSINSLGRWFGEPVRAAILQTNVIIHFIDLTNSCWYAVEMKIAYSGHHTGFSNKWKRISLFVKAASEAANWIF